VNQGAAESIRRSPLREAALDPMHKRIQLISVALGIALAFAAGTAAHKQSWPVYTVPRDFLKKVFPPVAGQRFGKGGTRWRRASSEHAGVRTYETSSTGIDGDIEVQIQALEALGYASGTQPSTADSGVKESQQTDSTTGYLLGTDGHAPVAWLMDFTGKVLHRWSMDYDSAFPGNNVDANTDGIGYFRRVALLPEGELLAIYEGQGMIKLDAQSNLVWAFDGLTHHDFEVQPDGTVYTLTRVAHVIDRVNPNRPILEDFATQLSADGEVLSTFSILEAVRDSPYRPLLQNSLRSGDIFHTNTIEVLDAGLAHLDPAFRNGNILLSLHAVHALVVVDAETERVVWALSGLTRLQHQPTVLDNEHLMVFDNKGDLGMSRVIEVDVETNRIVWEYSGQQHDFFSATCGSAQRLASGNTLITESDRGRAFIVTPSGRTIWEYVTPHRTGPDDAFIATLFEVIHLPSEIDLSWLADLPH
jgi:hypothetical protein